MNEEINNQDALQEEASSPASDFGRCEQERKEYLEGWQRTKADHINYKKEEAKRLEDMARFITAGLVQDLLPVLDSFELAIRSMPASGATSDKGHEQGVLLIRTQLLDVLKRRGLEPIEVTPGEEFNPERHESIGEVEAEFPPGTVAEEIQKGFMLRERIVRPSRVRIVKSSS